MSIYSCKRREFLRNAAASSIMSFLPRFAFGSALPQERTSWFRKAKFGMFVHWGPYSLASVEASWPIIMPSKGGISEAEYTSLPSRFNPTGFNPHLWVQLAREAGQRYMVFTTKHHDGFCMFDSQYTDYKVTKTPYGQDVVAQLAKACHEDGMPLGLYYSPPDMHHPDYRDTSKPVSSNWQGQPERPEWPIYLDYMSLQLTELLTNYGPVAIIWFDEVNSDQAKYNGRHALNLIHELQPAALVNNRIGLPGDYETPEQFIPSKIPTRGIKILGLDRSVQDKLRGGVPAAEDFRLWESCMTINNQWAYNKNDHDFKSSESLIRNLVEVASRGGNLLLNVGPQPDGVIQVEFQERLRAIGRWLAINGESIYDTTFGPLQELGFARTTARGNLIYVHVFDWPGSSLTLSGLKAKVVSARFLQGGKPIKFTQDVSEVRMDVPSRPLDPNVTVIELQTYQP